MRQEEKELLLKDLSARLPYGVKCLFPVINRPEKLTGMFENTDCLFGLNRLPIEKVKPYLFPLSSMTEAQLKEINSLLKDNLADFRVDEHGNLVIERPFHIDREEDRYLYLSWDELNVYKEWCLKNHFDINGLIAYDLAIDATGLNIY